MTLDPATAREVIGRLAAHDPSIKIDPVEGVSNVDLEGVMEEA